MTDTSGANQAARALGAALRGHRLANGLSLRKLARQVGLSGHGTLVDYEHGRRIPPEDLLIACEDALGLTGGQLRRLRRAALVERTESEAAALMRDGPAPADERPPPETAPAQTPQTQTPQARTLVVQTPSVADQPPTYPTSVQPTDTVPPVAARPPVALRRRRRTVAVLAGAFALTVAALLTLATGVLGSAAGSTVAGAGSQPSATTRVRFDFERPEDRWWILWGDQVARVSVSDSVAFEGRRSLLVTVTGASAAHGYSAVGVTHDLTGLAPGMTVSLRLWTATPDTGGVRFFAMDSASKVVWAPESPDGTELPLPHGPAWTSMTWTVPPVDTVHGIGMQIYSETSAPLVVAIDAVNW